MMWRSFAYDWIVYPFIGATNQPDLTANGCSTCRPAARRRKGGPVARGSGARRQPTPAARRGVRGFVSRIPLVGDRVAAQEDSVTTLYGNHDTPPFEFKSRDSLRAGLLEVGARDPLLPSFAW